jgi:tryptophanyl-tRNA synthetase
VSRNANDESEVDESLLNAGLFTYPVLQAADILAYRATEVPVGEDQQQHLELSRDLADIFNRTFKGNGTMFPLPQPVITPSRRVLSLRDPSAKMSKSAPDPASRIMLTDSSSQINKKIKGAVTDSVSGISYDPVSRPGISNLLTILSSCTGQDMPALSAQYASYGHGDFKSVVADVVEELFKGPRLEFERIRTDEGYLEQVAREGAEKARARTEVTMREVRVRLGLA